MDVSRQVLVDAAVGVFTEGGFDEASPLALMRWLGVGAEAVYRHFKSRDDLLAAVLSRVQVDIFGHIEACCPVVAGESGLEMIVRLAEAYRLYFESRPLVYCDLLRPPAALRPLAGEQSARELRRLADRVAKQFEVLLLLGRLDGSVRAEASAEAARRVVSLLAGTVRLRLTQARGRNLKAMLRALVGPRSARRAA